jgi:hypothetical protein
LVRLKHIGFIGSDHFPILVGVSQHPELADEQETWVMVAGRWCGARWVTRVRHATSGAYVGTTAVVSISTLARSSISALTSTTAIAG